MDISQIIFLSVLTSFCAVLLNLIPALVLGYLCARKNFKGKFFVEAVLCIPLVLPPVVTGYILLLVFSRNSFAGKILALAGLEIPFSFTAAVIAAAVAGFPLMFRTIKLAVSQVDIKYEQAARTLGCGFFKTFFRVVLPLAGSGIISASVLCFARALGEFGATIMFAGNIPGKTRTLSLAIFSAFSSSGNDSTVTILVGFSLLCSFLALFAAEYIERQNSGRAGA